MAQVNIQTKIKESGKIQNIDFDLVSNHSDNGNISLNLKTLMNTRNVFTTPKLSIETSQFPNSNFDYIAEGIYNYNWRLVASDTNGNIFYKSSSGWAKSKVLPSSLSRGAVSMLSFFKPGNIFVSCFPSGSGSGAYTSSDGGQLWGMESDLPPTQLRNLFIPKYGNLIFGVYPGALKYSYTGNLWADCSGYGKVLWGIAGIMSAEYPSRTATTLPISKSYIYILVTSIEVEGTPQIYYSENGIDWSACSIDSTNLLNTPVFGNGMFVTSVAQDDSTGSTTPFFYSYDGITWTNSSSVLSKGETNELYYGNGLFICTVPNTTNPTFAYSYDGITWETQTISTVTQQGYFLGFVNDRFYYCTTSGVYQSADGKNWSLATKKDGSPLVLSFSSNNNTAYMIYSNGLYVCCDNTHIYCSHNGVSDWLLMEFPNNVSASGIKHPTFADGSFYIPYNGGIYTIKPDIDLKQTLKFL